MTPPEMVAARHPAPDTARGHAARQRPGELITPMPIAAAIPQDNP
jgi:hypothetical protein